MRGATFGLTLALILHTPALLGGVYELPSDGELVGAVTQTTSHTGETLLDIARRHNLGYEELKRANPAVDPLLLSPGSRITLPTQFLLPNAPRIGLVLNLAEMRLYYYPQASPADPAANDGAPAAATQLFTYPVGIGQHQSPTPSGPSRITAKIPDPNWTPPPSVRADYLARGITLPGVVPPGPDNPLGRFAMQLANPHYLIHGTNKPDGIGMRVSRGCIRLFPEDMEALFQRVATGTVVQIVDQPYKVGWHRDRLYLEVHPPGYPDAPTASRSDLVRAIIRATQQRRAEIDWAQVERIRRAADGIPQPIGSISSSTVAQWQ